MVSQHIEKVYMRATQAAADWRKKSVKERTFFLPVLKELIVQRQDEISSQIIKESGKVPVDVLINGILPVLEIISYYEKRAVTILKTEKRSAPFPLFYRNKAWLEYAPMGTVLVIAPWNYPFQLAIIPVISALLAGNAVVLKSSELTPISGQLIKGLLNDCNLPKDLFQLVEGGSDIGKELINAGPDKIFFTGSVEVGKEIMAQAAGNLIPLDLELGGKDPMLVFADADLERAVEAALYGAFINSGQFCVSIERLYLQEEIYQVFLERLKNKVKKLRPGIELGKIINQEQMDKINELIDKAIQQGATLETEYIKKDLYLSPVILSGCNHKMEIMQQEIFGPVLTVIPFESEEDALRLANDSKFGLNASVWTSDLERGKGIISSLETGNCYLNGVLKNVGNPDLPFGGIKESGIGRYHGSAGLKTFCQEKAVMHNKNKGHEFYWFPFADSLKESIKSLIELRYSSQTLKARLSKYLKLFRTFLEKK
ncbi:MAG: aldehyde dehydrogenase family protein [Bacillota bacterium]